MQRKHINSANGFREKQLNFQFPISFLVKAAAVRVQEIYFAPHDTQKECFRERSVLFKFII